MDIKKALSFYFQHDCTCQQSHFKLEIKLLYICLLTNLRNSMAMVWKGNLILIFLHLKKTKKTTYLEIVTKFPMYSSLLSKKHFNMNCFSSLEKNCNFAFLLFMIVVNFIYFIFWFMCGMQFRFLIFEDYYITIFSSSSYFQQARIS